jgi:hypothetical protein
MYTKLAYLLVELVLYSFGGAMKILRIVSLVLFMETICPGQMTPSEKAADFTQLAATYAVNYGPLDWKRTALNFDLLKIGDWFEQSHEDPG